MNAIQTMAIAKAIKDAALKAARAELSIGMHDVDVIAHVKGSINVFEDEKYTPVAELSVYGLFIDLYEQFRGIAQQAQIDNFEDMVVGAMQRCIERDLKGADKTAQFCENEAKFEALKARAQATFGKLPDKTRKGKVTTNLTVTELVEAA